MPKILINCPVRRKVVPTGLATEKIKFESLGEIEFTLVCPACGRMHRWEKKTAWVEGEPEAMAAASQVLPEPPAGWTNVFFAGGGSFDRGE